MPPESPPPATPGAVRRRIAHSRSIEGRSSGPRAVAPPDAPQAGSGAARPACRGTRTPASRSARRTPRSEPTIVRQNDPSLDHWWPRSHFIPRVRAPRRASTRPDEKKRPREDSTADTNLKQTISASPRRCGESFGRINVASGGAHSACTRSMTSSIFVRDVASRACGTLAGMRTTVPGAAATGRPPMVSAQRSVQHEHERVERRRVLTEPLAGIEREQRHVSTAGLGEHAAGDSLLRVREQGTDLEGLGGWDRRINHARGHTSRRAAPAITTGDAAPPGSLMPLLTDGTAGLPTTFIPGNRLLVPRSGTARRVGVAVPARNLPVVGNSNLRASPWVQPTSAARPAASIFCRALSSISCCRSKSSRRPRGRRRATSTLNTPEPQPTSSTFELGARCSRSASCDGVIKSRRAGSSRMNDI